MRRLLLSSAGILAATLLTACPDRDVTEVNPIQDNVDTKVIPVTLNRDLDILFVVDNSGSMAGEQASLAANFPSFIGVLQTIEGGLPNVHIGILSSNVGAAPGVRHPVEPVSGTAGATQGYPALWGPSWRRAEAAC